MVNKVDSRSLVLPGALILLLTLLPVGCRPTSPTATPTSPPTNTPLPTATLIPVADDVPMVRVPAGEFIMGSDVEEVFLFQDQALEQYRKQYEGQPTIVTVSSRHFANELPRHTVYLNEFHIDKYEVTNARYRRCVEAGICQSPFGGFPPSPTYDDHPVVLIAWADAEAYCRWAGKRLPTEVEWEKAARGTDGRLWPWGNEWEEGRANTFSQRGDTAPVGSYPDDASPYGVMDMAGNVREWVEDWAQLYPGNPYQMEDIPEVKIMRGGAYHSEDQTYVRTAIRFAREATVGAGSSNGFRCVVGGPHPTPQPTATPTPTGTPDVSRWEEMILIPAGEFLMGSKEDDPAARFYEKPQHKVYLDAFYIDKYEVTHAQYAEFLNDIGHHRWGCYGHDCTVIRGEDLGQFTHILYTEGQYLVEKGYENYPVVLVGWYGVRAYCEHYGLRLPTEAEWEKAARGTDGRIWPWGSEWDPDKVTTSGDLFHRRDIAPVGSKPEGASPYGVLDMAGNVSEWAADWWASDYYSHSPYYNPTGPDTGENKVLRGGKVADEDGYGVRTARRSSISPGSTLGDEQGFRCAKDSQN